MLAGISSDFRFGLRFYRRNPGFTALAVLVLALGIGSTTALFSVFDAVLLRPLSLSAPQELVAIWESAPLSGLPRNTPAPADFVDWKSQTHSFLDMAASNQTAASVTGGEGRPESLLGRRVTENLFEVLGTPAALGRVIVPDDARASEAVVVISDGLWRRRFGADPAVVGQTLRLDGTPYSIVGVMPRGFVYPAARFEFWIPARWTPSQAASRNSHYLQVVGRLKPGVSLEVARAEVREIANRSSPLHAEKTGIGALVLPLAEDLAGAAHGTLPVLLAAAGLLLLIACANVANLLLAKALGRKNEMGVRQALGASRWRLVRQTAAESLLLGLVAGGLGVGLAAMLLGAVRRLVPASLSGLVVQLDPRVLAVALALSLLTALLFGLAPAMALVGDPWRRLGGARGGVGASRLDGRLRDLLVVVEVALALVLLVGAGLAIRSLGALTEVDVGFRTERLLTLSTRLPRTAYAEPARRLAFYQRVLEQVRSLPGVERAAFVSNLPFTSHGNSTSFAIEGRPFRDGEPNDLLYRVGSDDYLETVGLRLLEGRFYQSTDTADSQPVVVINDTLRRRFFPEGSPLGRRLEIGGAWRSIIGVVADAKETGFEASPRSGGYLPVVQNGTAWAIPEYLAVRTTGDPMALAPAIRAAIWSVDPEQPVAQLRVMEEWMALDVAERRSQRTLLAAFSGLALLLASLGIYGVLAYTVSRRRREIGVRMALGATPRDIVGMVGRSGFRLVGVGIAAGGLASLLLVRAMAATLYGVRPTDPVTYGAVAVLLALAGAIAAARPAHRAASVDPSAALRDE